MSTAFALLHLLEICLQRKKWFFATIPAFICCLWSNNHICTHHGIQGKQHPSFILNVGLFAEAEQLRQLKVINICWHPFDIQHNNSVSNTSQQNNSQSSRFPAWSRPEPSIHRGMQTPPDATRELSQRDSGLPEHYTTEAHKAEFMMGFTVAACLTALNV